MNFFDFQEKQSQRKQGATDAKLAGAISVSQLTALVDRALKAGVPARVYVRGEVSNLNIHKGSGHIYFTLKDPNACVDCVMFKSDAAKLKFSPEDGMELIASGRIGIYAQRGRYQLYVTSLHPIGRGALELAFQQLKEKLEKEGLFAPERKKPIPEYPTRIAIVTSRQTAALQDIFKVLKRFPFLDLSVFHVPVQGEGSAELIADAVRLLQSRKPDVIILARGGGSLEDLWEFNEEIVARAIAKSSIPVVSGIGHEVDVSIADLVADYHAHTPTEAAQVVTSGWRQARNQLDATQVRISGALQNISRQARQRLVSIERHEFFRRPTQRINTLRQYLDEREKGLLFGLAAIVGEQAGRLAAYAGKLSELHPRNLIRISRQRLNGLTASIDVSARTRMKQRSLRVDLLDGRLEALSPSAVLRRGYSITTLKRGGVVVRSKDQVKPGEPLLTRLADGSVESTVRDSSQSELFE